jgi:hypothetical protein
MLLFRANRQLIIGLLAAITIGGVSETVDVSTREDRAALFDYLYEKTLEREAFSEIKNQRLGLDIPAAMRALKDEIVDAENDEDLFYAIVKLSNARRDRHLRIRPVEGGLRAPEGYDTHANTNYPYTTRGPEDILPTVPVRFYTDFGEDPYRVFVRDHAMNWEEKVHVGDRVVAVNGSTLDDYMERIRPYIRYSSENGFWVRAAETLNEKTPILPVSFYESDLRVDLVNRDGDSYSLKLPYLASDTVEWTGHGERSLDDYGKVLETQTFDLYRHKAGRKVLLFIWHRFSDTLHEDMDEAMAWADAEGALGFDLIFDGTVSSGGGRGVYAIQRLSPKPFKLTFGNLRVSDVTETFVKDMVARIDERQAREGGTGGQWLKEWLLDDVMKAIEAGQAYTNNVPFKSAYLPKWSDGVVKPAAVHFTGKMVCLLGPYGGSHLDQFAATVVDNDLCHTIGMPTGGYSNTWEWEEVVKFPISGKPVVEYMWSIGHTIRPNGEVLEGNPADVKEYIPVTAQNYEDYYGILFERAYAWLDRKEN